MRAGPVGKWDSSVPMLEKKSPVKLLPLMAGMLDGAIHPIKPKPITLKSVLSQSLSKLHNQEDDQFYKLIISVQSLGDSLYINYHVNFPPEACASLKGFLAVTGDFRNPGKRKRDENKEKTQ